MSEAPPDADAVKVGRIFTAFTPTPKTQPEGGRSRTVVWVVGGCIVVALAVGALCDAAKLDAPAPTGTAGASDRIP